jgi:hypothetical protein
VVSSSLMLNRRKSRQILIPLGFPTQIDKKTEKN